MAVKILIKRKIPKGFKDPKFNKLIRHLRALTTVHQGYISGETLKRIDDPQDKNLLDILDRYANYQTISLRNSTLFSIN
jgi:hypothetical protein